MRTLIKTTIPAVIAVFMTACGGNDNSSKDNDQNSKALTYQGITEPVVLTEDNKEKVASEVIKFIKEYSIYRDFEAKSFVLYSEDKPFNCRNEDGSETKLSYFGNKNERTLFTHKYDDCFVKANYSEDFLVVSGESTYSFFELNSLVSDVFGFEFGRNRTTNIDLTLRGFPGTVKVVSSYDESIQYFDYSELDEAKDDDIVSTALNSAKNSFSNSFYRIETSYINESVHYVDEDSSYIEEFLFKFNGGESVKLQSGGLDYEYSGLFGWVGFSFGSLGLPSIGVLSGYTYGEVEVCSDGSDLGYDSAYKNDFSSGSMDVISGDKRLTIVYVGCGEYSVTLGDAIL